jgi:hypothetical protein
MAAETEPETLCGKHAWMTIFQISGASHFVDFPANQASAHIEQLDGLRTDDVK